MNIDLIIECDRCKEKNYISVKNIDNMSIVDIIVRNSAYIMNNIFGNYLLICPKCQKAFVEIIEKRKQETENFKINFKE